MISPKDQELIAKLFSNNMPEEKKTIPLVTPPPVPPKITSQIQTLADTIQINLQKDRQEARDTGSKKTYLFRRGIIIVFEETSFELFLQQNWIKKVLNELQINFERKFISNQDQNQIHSVITVLRLRIFHANGVTSVKEFISDKTIHDEMAFKLNNAFVIIKDSPLSEDWFNFLTQKLNTKIIYYLSRTRMDQNHYKNYSLLESENLFISLIKKLLVINEQVEIAIADLKERIKIIDPVIRELMNVENNHKPSKLAISSAVTNCMGHGGPTDESIICQTCRGSLCTICADSFLICPGSMVTELHKFIKK